MGDAGPLHLTASPRAVGPAEAGGSAGAADEPPDEQQGDQPGDHGEHPLQYRCPRGVQQVDRVGGRAWLPARRRAEPATAPGAAARRPRSPLARERLVGDIRVGRRRRPSWEARHSANCPTSLPATSAITPRPNCAGLPVTFRSVTTDTCAGALVDQGGPDRRSSRPRSARLLAVGLDHGHPCGLVPLDEPGRAVVRHRDRAQPHLDPALEPAVLLAVDVAVERRPGHARGDPLDVHQDGPGLCPGDRDREVVLQLHQTPAAAITARRVSTRARCRR